MQTQVESMTVGLDTILYHLRRAVELLKELQDEQQGAGPTHILENLAILDVDTAASVDRLTRVIREMRGEEKAA